MNKSRCYIEIDTNKFRNNVKKLLAYLPESTKVIGVVKANYYGHGDVALAKIMVEEGINDFAVVTLGEALKLRESGITGSIQLLGFLEKKYWNHAIENDIIIPIVSYENALLLNKFCLETNQKVKVEVKVDTGMHRIGVDPSIDDEQLKFIYDNPNLIINGTFSHLCRADSFDDEDKNYTAYQKEVFDTFLQRVKNLGLSVGRTHLCASSGILNYPEYQYDYVRPGFMLLGFNVGQTNEPFEREPILSWYSKVVMVKDVKENEGISYGHIYHTDSIKKIATISVGYGDGYPRRLSNNSYVVINGKKANIVGRICMDQMMVDVSEIDDVKPNDIVTLIGEGVSANELALKADTIVDEIVCLLNDRVKRFYI